VVSYGKTRLFHRSFSEKLLALENAGEPAVLFCFIFLFMATYGAGIWSANTGRLK
jgi:uncharacterized membrane protein YphA (DoxX/SURF4 family)